MEEHQKMEKSDTEHSREGKKHNILTRYIIVLMALVVVLALFNQYQIYTVSGMMTGMHVASSSKELRNINLDELKSTGHTVAAVFPVEEIRTQDDAVAIMVATGTPDYGPELGVSYDKPLEALDTLSKMYRGLKAEVQQNNPAGWNRFMNLASRPVGISCEYCCGVGPIGVDKNGNSACGCQHNPALLSVALYLSAYTDYTDGEILREVMRWKTLFFPKDMVELGMTVAGGDTSTLDTLPGMVGGC